MKILFLQKRILFPAHTGGHVRTLNLLRHLARWHEVTYLCNLQPGEEQYLPPMRELGLRMETLPWREAPRRSVRWYRNLALNLLSRYPYSACKDYDPALRARAARLLAEEPYDLVVCDFVQMARNVLGLKVPPTILFQHNVEAQVWQRLADTSPGWLRRRYLALQARKMRRFEAEAGRQFDAVIAVSECDRQVFQKSYGWDHVHCIDPAVDLDHFRPTDAEHEQPGRLVFVGSMDWLPNEDSVVFFVRAVWPLVRRRHPDARFQIVGRNPSAAVRRLQDEAGVEVVGTVPDVRPYLAEAAVVVVPILAGSGTRNKIFEAMAMRKAVVSTTLGAEGLPVVPGKHLLVEDTTPGFAEAVNRLLAEPDQRRRLGRAAHELVSPRYSAENAARQFEAICLETVEHRARPGGSPAGRAG